jgi:hypothetical protein
MKCKDAKPERTSPIPPKHENTRIRERRDQGSLARGDIQLLVTHIRPVILLQLACMNDSSKGAISTACRHFYPTASRQFSVIEIAPCNVRLAPQTHEAAATKLRTTSFHFCASIASSLSSCASMKQPIYSASQQSFPRVFVPPAHTRASTHTLLRDRQHETIPAS